MEARTMTASTGAKVTIRWDTLNGESAEEIRSRFGLRDRVAQELLLNAARRIEKAGYEGAHCKEKDKAENGEDEQGAERIIQDEARKGG